MASSCSNILFATSHGPGELILMRFHFSLVVCVLSAHGNSSKFKGRGPARTAKSPSPLMTCPPAPPVSMSAATLLDMTTKLLTTLRDQKIPVVGFVNERKLYKFGEVDDRIKALRMWLDYGFELGNHTYSHSSLNQVGLQAWEDDIVQGETVTKLLLAEHNMKLRYFRHPYLDTGRDLQTRRQAEAFLANRGYRIAPVTLDAWDWMYAGVYEDAKKRGDTALQDELTQELSLLQRPGLRLHRAARETDHRL